MAKNQIDFSPTNPENRAAGAPLTRFQDVETAETEQTDVEIVVGDETEETKPEVVTMTPEEFAALKAQSDSTRALKEGIEGLGASLRSPVSAPPPPANAPTQTPEEYFAEHSDEIFDKEKGAGVLAKHSKMIAEREYGPLLRGLSTSLSNTRKELLESKDPHFKRYKAEIEALVSQQPADVQIAPDVWERAWVAIRQKHAPEIEAESVKAQVDAAVNAKLKELGIDPTKLANGNARPAVHINSEGRSQPGVTNAARPKVRLPDAATKAKFEAEAKRKGMDIEDLLRARGYM